MTNPDLEAVLQQLRQLFAAEYARGEADAINRIMQAAQGKPGDVQTNGHDIRRQAPRRGRKGKRAPHGAAMELVARVLSESGANGATAIDIQDAAKTPVEQQVSYSGIRFALAKGRDKGLYRNKGGRWYPRKSGTAEQAEA